MTRSLPSDWGYRREEVLEKHGYECANCGKSGQKGGTRLEVHHIVPREVGGTHKLSNLIPLCSPCHFAVHYTDTQAPTGGPTIDYDQLVQVVVTPPELRSEDEKQHLEQTKEKLREYAGEEYFRYLPMPDPTANIGMSPHSSSRSYRALTKTDSDRWDHLRAKWSAKR
jgi:hypothetical protein